MLQPLLASTFLLVSTGLFAQQVNYLDLTGIKPRTTLRYPPAPAPKPVPRVCNDGLCTGVGIAGGFMSVGISCGAGDWRAPRALKTTLTWLSQMDYQIGDDVAFEIQLENAGSETMLVPWTPHLSDLQPADDSKPFDYLELDLNLVIKAGTSTIMLSLPPLYGSMEMTGTVVELPPGAWVRIGNSVKLVVDENARKHVTNEPDATWMVNVHFGYRRDSFHPHIGGYDEEISNDYPRNFQGDALPIRIHAVTESDLAMKPDQEE